ncbi:hypothetical protein MP228_009552 [Amoeboaphelidium protococcarum]|nr:hypothetical protein MP228_009552 [Amoeboaphelidium protococcarum]
MKIKQKYVPKAKRNAGPLQSDRKWKDTYASQRIIYVKCPNCQQNIKESEFNKHLRIELLDPKWAQQKKIELDRRGGRSSNLLDDGAQVHQFLSHLQSGDDGNDKSAAQSQSASTLSSINSSDAHSNAHKRKPVLWDGTTESISITTKTAIAVQLQQGLDGHLHNDKPLIGPQLPKSKK